MHDEQWRNAQAAVRERDEECRRCYAPAGDVHHRQVKGMGGTSGAKRKYGLENLVLLCRICHGEVHADPAHSYACGFLVHSWDDPAAIPLVTAGVRTWLHKDGTVTREVCALF